MKTKIIALLGSPRGKNTVSESIVNYIGDKNTALNIIKYRAHEIFNREEKLLELWEDLKDAKAMLICTPVFVHSLPYPNLKTLEIMASSNNSLKDIPLYTIVHCGYPEDYQRQSSFRIISNFARCTGMLDMGHIGFGGSPIIDAKPLEEVGFMVKWMRKSLESLGLDILSGNYVSKETIRLSHKHFPRIPKSILVLMMNRMVKGKYKKLGLDPYAKPYLTQKASSSKH